MCKSHHRPARRDDGSTATATGTEVTEGDGPAADVGGSATDAGGPDAVGGSGTPQGAQGGQPGDSGYSAVPV